MIVQFAVLKFVLFPLFLDLSPVLLDLSQVFLDLSPVFFQNTTLYSCTI